MNFKAFHVVRGIHTKSMMIPREQHGLLSYHMTMNRKGSS